LPVHKRAINLAVVIIEEYCCYQHDTKFIQHSSLPYIDEVIGDHQSGFRRMRSTTDQIFRNRLILKNKWKYIDRVHQLFVDFEKAYDLVRRKYCTIF
jgi:hypothetical protein